MNKEIYVPIPEKFTLTVSEASEYFNIGDKNLRKIITDDTINADFVLQNGNKYLIKRKKFEEFLNQVTAI